jgi:AcrR family transcriptional regulator
LDSVEKPKKRDKENRIRVPNSGDTTARIVDAARRLFTKRGFTGTSTKQIAREAGVSEMTLFRHFSSKELLFRAVVEPLVSFFDGLVVAEDVNLNTAVKHLIQDRLSFLCEESDLVRLVLMESYLTSLSFDPIAETVGKIKKVFASLDKPKADLYLRLTMGFILTCIFLPEDCSETSADVDELMKLLE